MSFKPMLASPAPENLDFKSPWLASPKLDGVRAVVRNGVVLSRALKPIPNEHVQSLFAHLEHFDGELIVGIPTSPDVLRSTTSGVMSKEGTPDVKLYVFDHFERPEDPFHTRHAHLIRARLPRNVIIVQQLAVSTTEQLAAYEDGCLRLGYEGAMLRRPEGRYKFGRSTAREGLLLKLKRFHDDEFEIVGFEERQHNGNEASVSELGRTKRSSHKANKTGRGDLGALILKYGDTTFNCGTGFDDGTRAEIWANREQYLGQFAKVKYFAHGIKDVPKLPSFLGIRHRGDM